MAEPLSAAQRAELAAELARLAIELREQLQRVREGAGVVTLDQQSVGRLSRMDALQQQAMAQASEKHMREHLQRVELALRAVDEEYGFCRECGEAIGYPRLRARPDTFLCLACQAVREQPR
jgi:DnaK suppressor protein